MNNEKQIIYEIYNDEMESLEKDYTYGNISTIEYNQYYANLQNNLITDLEEAERNG